MAKEPGGKPSFCWWTPPFCRGVAKVVQARGFCSRAGRARRRRRRGWPACRGRLSTNTRMRFFPMRRKNPVPLSRCTCSCGTAGGALGPAGRLRGRRGQHPDRQPEYPGGRRGFGIHLGAHRPAGPAAGRFCRAGSAASPASSGSPACRGRRPTAGAPAAEG